MSCQTADSGPASARDFYASTLLKCIQRSHRITPQRRRQNVHRLLPVAEYILLLQDGGTKRFRDMRVSLLRLRICVGLVRAELLHGKQLFASWGRFFFSLAPNAVGGWQRFGGLIFVFLFFSSTLLLWWICSVSLRGVHACWLCDFDAPFWIIFRTIICTEINTNQD